MHLRRTIATAAVIGALATASAGMAAPAQAQPVITGGLVNVTIVDVIDDVTVTVRDINVALAAAVNIGANVCGVNAAVLAANFIQNGEATCTNEQTGQTVTIDQV